MRDGPTLHGQFVGATESQLSLSLKAHEARTISRDRIARIDRTDGHVMKGALIGAGVGAGTGLITSIGCRGPGIGLSEGQCTAVVTGFFTIIGAVVGSVIGLHRGKSLVYQASPIVAQSLKGGSS